MFCEALDTHPDILCWRSEPIKPGNQFENMGLTRHQTPELLWSTEGYKAVGFKVTYKQWRWLKGAHWIDRLRSLQVKIIHLVRGDVVRCVLSSMLGAMARDGEIDRPLHTREPLPTYPVITVDPAEFVKRCKDYKRAVHLMGVELEDTYGIMPLGVTYEQLTGGEMEISKLPRDVVKQALTHIDPTLDKRPALKTSYARLNHTPLSDMILNWPQLATQLRIAGFEVSE